MSNGKAMIIRLIFGLIRKMLYRHHIKMSEYFRSRMNLLEETLLPNWIYLITHQKPI